MVRFLSTFLIFFFCLNRIENYISLRVVESLLVYPFTPLPLSIGTTFMTKKSEVVKIPKESYKDIKEIQSSLYEEYDMKAHLGIIIKHLIEKSKESAENLTEWLRDSIKAEKNEKDKKKVLSIFE